MMRSRLMIKEFCLTLILFFGIAAALIYPHTAAAIGLKNNSIIENNAIMLSDIFTGLPEGKDKVLGPAPQPGKDMTLNARTLMRIAIALDLPWRPSNSAEYVTLSRAATVIDTQMIKDALQLQMAENGITGNYKLAFAGPMTEIILPLDQPANVEVKSLNIRTDQNRFEATLVAPSKESPIQTLHVSGAIQRMIDVPVLSETFRNGMVIRARDIDILSIREEEVQHDLILSADELIGMTPRRVVLPGKLIKINDLEQPLVVERGDLVTMTFKEGSMTLTAKAKALEDGAKGDLIRVSNTNTSRTVDAIVTGEREVIVKTF